MTVHHEKRAAALLLPGAVLEEVPDDSSYTLQVPGLPTTQFKTVRGVPDDEYLDIVDYTRFAANPFGKVTE